LLALTLGLQALAQNMQTLQQRLLEVFGAWLLFNIYKQKEEK
jgi:hypothetical protein